MEAIIRNISIIIPVVIMLVFIAFIAYAIYRRIKGKPWLTSGSVSVGRNIYMDFENKEKRTAMEEVIYQEEDEREEADGGEDPEPGPKFIDPDEENGKL